MDIPATFTQNDGNKWEGVVNFLDHDVKATGKSEAECRKNLRRALYDDLHSFYAEQTKNLPDIPQIKQAIKDDEEVAEQMLDTATIAGKR